MPRTLKSPPGQQKRTRWGAGGSHIGGVTLGMDKSGRGGGLRGRILKLGHVWEEEWCGEQCPA